MAGDPASVPSPLGIRVTLEELAEIEQMIAQDPRTALIMYGARNWQQFGGMWVNEPGVGTVMRFTADLERHRQAIAAIAGNQPFEVRHSRFTEFELRSLQHDLVDDLVRLPGAEFLSLGLDVKSNVLQLEIKSNDASLKERLEAQHGGRLRVDLHPLPGPWQNAAFGPGWRLLAAGQSASEAYRVRAATSSGEWVDLWSALDPVNAAPEIDLETEIAVSFGHGIGSSCPEVRLDEVVIDHAHRRVFSVTSDPLAPRACTADLAGGAWFVVALERSSLPESPFRVDLRADRVGGGDAGIEVDLR